MAGSISTTILMLWDAILTNQNGSSEFLLRRLENVFNNDQICWDDIIIRDIDQTIRRRIIEVIPHTCARPVENAQRAIEIIKELSSEGGVVFSDIFRVVESDTINDISNFQNYDNGDTEQNNACLSNSEVCEETVSADVRGIKYETAVVTFILVVGLIGFAIGWGIDLSYRYHFGLIFGFVFHIIVSVVIGAIFAGSALFVFVVAWERFSRSEQAEMRNQADPVDEPRVTESMHYRENDELRSLLTQVESLLKRIERKNLYEVSPKPRPLRRLNHGTAAATLRYYEGVHWLGAMGWRKMFWNTKVKAIEHFTSAATLGSAAAADFLSDIYTWEGDYESARIWYEKSKRTRSSIFFYRR